MASRPQNRTARQQREEAAHQAYAENADEPPAPPRDEEARSGEEEARSDARAERDASEQDAQGVRTPQEDKLTDVERERDEYLDALRRERAEFENFRKRTTKERMDALDRGAEQLITSLLGVLDNFGFALEAAGTAEGGDPLAKGVRMVHTELVDALRTAGLEELPGVGAEFDPTIHEAVAQVDASEALGEQVSDPVVIEVLRPGYGFKGRILRPASVKVAR